MPLYEYECKEHGVFDVLQNINDESIAFCPICHRQCKKLISRCSCVIASQAPRFGNTRKELFDNLMAEELGGTRKDFHDIDQSATEECIIGAGG